MPQKIDSAILKALSLNADTASISSHGGSGFSSTFKISAKDGDGNNKLYFVKTGKGKDSEVMFVGQYECSWSLPTSTHMPSMVSANLDLITSQYRFIEKLHSRYSSKAVDN